MILTLPNLPTDFVNWWMKNRAYWKYMYPEDVNGELSAFYVCIRHQKCEQWMKKTFYNLPRIVKIFELSNRTHNLEVGGNNNKEDESDAELEVVNSVFMIINKDLLNMQNWYLSPFLFPFHHVLNEGNA
uniref:Uncharacterized protein n=1 Tax=Meloidogyne enterolobii TaxID=390850 RepID=A0A6V7UJJ1_MELEN|nr:unnamed protein product [Meloidogyne enterolobii]